MTEEKDLAGIEDNVVVVFRGEDGEELYFVEEEVFSVGDNTYAVLTSVVAEGEAQGCGCGHNKHEHEGCKHFHEHHPEYIDDAESEAIIAKIVEGDNGELEYIEPTDEEFEIALEAFEHLLEDSAE